MSPADSKRRARVAARSDRTSDAIRTGVDTLTDAAGGQSPFLAVADMCRRSEMVAVAAVATHLGFAPDEDDVVTAVAAVDMGTDPVHAMADACGVVARPVTLPPDWFHKDGAPAVVTMAGAQEVPHTRAIAWRRGWRFIDAPAGKGAALTAEQAAQVSRRAVELVPRLADGPATRRDLWTFCLRGSRSEWFVLGGTTLIVGVVAFITPLLIGKIGAAVSVGASSEALIGLFLALTCVALALALWRAIRSAAVSRLRSRFEARAFAALWDRCVRQSLNWHQSNKTSIRAKRVVAPDRAAASFSDDVVANLLDTIVIVGSLLAIATTTAPLLLGIVGSLAVEGVILWLLVRGAGERAAHFGAHDRVAGAVAGEGISQIDELRIWGSEAFYLKEWAKTAAPATTLEQQTRRATMRRMVVGAIWPVVTLAVLVAVSAFGETTFAQFVTAQTAAVAATMALATVMSAVNAGLVAHAMIGFVDPLLESSPESGDPAQRVLDGAVELRGVSYRFGDFEPVLRDVSFTVAPGEFVAITGAMGSGKSVLAQCLLGLYRPTTGSVLVDGNDLGSLDGDSVRRQIGSVLQLQGSPLLPTTIRNNVTMGRALSGEQIWRALDEVGVGDDVRAMELGLDTPTTNSGLTLSSGQRQQILVARALIGDPRILVLDAAMSALDVPSLTAVMGAVTDRAVTRIVVSHHREVVSRADRVVLLSDGTVGDIGTYDELVERSVRFRELMGLVAAE